MKHVVLIPFAVLAIFLMATSNSVTQAQNNKSESVKKTTESAKRVKTYDFGGDEINGDLDKFMVDFISTAHLSRYNNLIRIRQDFILEVLKSAEDL